MMRISNLGILIVIGFGLMLLSHVGVFFLFRFTEATGIVLPGYVISYPIIFGIATLLLTSLQRLTGILEVLALCSVPLVYWGWLTVTDSYWTSFSVHASSSMIVVMPLTLITVLCLTQVPMPSIRR